VRRLRDERGQVTVEFAGMLFWMLLTALVVWQLLLVAWTYNQASNAARTATRVDGRGGDARKAALNALSSPLRDGTTVRMDGERAKVVVPIPIVVPGVKKNDFSATRYATLPGTS
jgi:TadE-like protein